MVSDGLVVEPVLALEFLRDRLAQRRNAEHRRILGLAAADRGDRRLLDVVGRVEIGLADRQRDHLPAFRLQVARLLRHHHGRGGLHAGEDVGEEGHGRSFLKSRAGFRKRRNIRASAPRGNRFCCVGASRCGTRRRAADQYERGLERSEGQMGFSISWFGFEGKRKARVLATFGLRDLGTVDSKPTRSATASTRRLRPLAFSAPPKPSAAARTGTTPNWRPSETIPARAGVSRAIQAISAASTTTTSASIARIAGQ